MMTFEAKLSICTREAKEIKIMRLLVLLPLWSLSAQLLSQVLPENLVYFVQCANELLV